MDLVLGSVCIKVNPNANLSLNLDHRPGTATTKDRINSLGPK